MLKIVRFFDKLEDHIRAFLSPHPVVYSLIGGVGIVVFWEGVSIIIHSFSFFDGLKGGLILVAGSVTVLLATGLFISFFVGDTIIISGLNREKKIAERTAEETQEETHMLHNVKRKVDEIEKELHIIEEKLDKDIKIDTKINTYDKKELEG